MANKTELTDDMLDNLQEYYACDPEFCMRMANKYIEEQSEANLLEDYNNIFEDWYKSPVLTTEWLALLTNNYKQQTSV